MPSEPPITLVDTVPSTAPAGSIAAARPRRRWVRLGGWRKWLWLLLVLVALRVVLSIVLAPFLATRLSRVLGTEVEIGDVSLQPIDAIITLRNVTVHARGDAAAGAPIAAGRVRLDLQWLPLLHRSVVIRELALESARIELDRDADGGFGVAGLDAAVPERELPSGWSVALERIALRQSHVRVHDRATGEPAAIEALVRKAEVSGLRGRPTAFGKTPNVRIDALVSGGWLRVDGRYDWRDNGVALDATVRVREVPLAQAASYLAPLGWTDLDGVVSGRLRWRRVPQQRDVMSGRLVLRRGSVRVAGLDEPALSVRRGVAEIGAIDLQRRRIAIDAVTIQGATLALRPDAGAPIPLLVPVRAPPRGGTEGAAVAPWRWRIERFETASARMRIVTPDGAVDLRGRVRGENLGPGAYWSPLRVEMARGPVTAAFDGTAQLGAGVTIEGRLTAAGIALPGLARAAQVPWARQVQKGDVSADLIVQLETAAVDSQPLFVRGEIDLADVWIADRETDEFALGAEHIDLTLQELAAGERRGEDDAEGGLRVRIAEVTVRNPYVYLTRTPEGWVLPAAAEGGGDPAAEPAPETAVAAGPSITIRTLRTSGGQVTVVDELPVPAVSWRLAQVRGTATRVSLPALTFQALELRGADRRWGTVELAARRPDQRHFELFGDGMALAAATPYFQLVGLPYRFAAGTASFVARGVVDAERWRADAALTLNGPLLVAGEEALETELGMSLPAVLAVLQDPMGNITIPLTLAAGGASPAERVAAGVRTAMRRIAAHDAALGPTVFAPVTVLFQPGQMEITPAGLQQLEPIAELLATRPALVVELTAGASAADRRWLGERVLAAELDDGGGAFRGVLRALGMRDTRDRIRAALADRAQGLPGRLDPADEAQLARMLAETPPVAPEQLERLADRRAMTVARLLADGYGIAEDRILLRPSGMVAGLPSVRMSVGIDEARAAEGRHLPPATVQWNGEGAAQGE